MNGGSVLCGRAAKHRGRESVRTERRADFLNAAAQVFGEKGYHNASMAAIADAAECGTGTLYLYFENKEELYAALLEEKMLELTAVVKQRAGRGNEPWEAIHNALRAQLGFYERNRTFFQSFVRERLEMQATVKRERWERVTRAYERFIQHLEQLIKAGQQQKVIRPGDSRRLAIVLSGMVNQLTRDALRRQIQKPLVAQARFIIDLFGRGVGTTRLFPNGRTAHRSVAKKSRAGTL
jgi:AcrR family transcriptional regulator